MRSYWCMPDGEIIDFRSFWNASPFEYKGYPKLRLEGLYGFVSAPKFRTRRQRGRFLAAYRQWREVQEGEGT